MRRTPRTAWALAVVTAACVLGAPAPAHAELLDAYQRLAARKLSPAPLVPTVVPRTLRPAERSVEAGSTIGGRGYSIRITRIGTGGPDAVVAVTGGEFKTMRAILRDHRRAGFGSSRRTRIRGRRGYLLTRRSRPVARSLVWRERGVVQSVSSGTPRKISLANLRAIARGLDPLEREWFGTATDPEDSSEAFAVSTRRTVTASVSFEGDCLAPGASSPTPRVGRAVVTLLRRDGDRFSFDVAEHRRGSGNWSGTISGTIAATGITLEVRAAASIDGASCDTGPLTLRLDRRLASPD